MSTEITSFDSLNCALNGTNVVEASAGTGKTFNLQNLFARFVLEEGVRVKEILVVTFTEAATAELRDRIRQILLDVRMFWMKQTQAEGAEVDERIQALAMRVDKEVGLRRVNAALRDFDEAAIYTIHAFCQRMLQENAFESGVLFNAELETSTETLLTEAVQDFWRTNTYKAGFLQISLLKALRLNIDTLTRDARKVFSRLGADLKPLAEATQDECDAVLCQLRDCIDRLIIAWDREQIFDIIFNSHCEFSKDKKKGISEAFFERFSEKLNAARTADYEVSFFTDAALFSYEKLKQLRSKRMIKNGIEMPVHPFFQCCTELQELKESYRVLVLTYALTWIRRKMRLHKMVLQIRHFDDLLLELHNALQQDDHYFACLIRRKYQVALVDEFQDTDAIQYQIFRKLFVAAEKPLFMVGDPKQAIYSFRGADVHTYHSAQTEPGAKLWTLTHNYRSAPMLLYALNDWFGQHQRPFVENFIQYQPVFSGHGDVETATEFGLLKHGYKDLTPLSLTFFPDPSSDAVFVERCCAEVVKQVQQLLSSDVLSIPVRTDDGVVSQRSLTCGDIAILVNKHREANQLATAFSQTGIPVVIQASESVFASPEAKSLVRLLQALLEPSDLTVVKGALATPLFGFTLSDLLLAFAQEESLQMVWLESFWNWHHIWRCNSFFRAFTRLAAECNIRARLVASGGGLRRLTNILQLVELLHEKEMSAELGPDALAAWLVEQVYQTDKSMREEDAYQMRLETDERALKIMTIHNSKGLEFPIVFCPFTLMSTVKRVDAGEMAEFHEGDRQVLHLQPDCEQRELAFKETLAERMRLLYVALTRAKHRCYVYAGNRSKASSNSLSILQYLLAGDVVSDESEGTVDLQEVSQHVDIKSVDYSSLANSDYVEINEVSEVKETDDTKSFDYTDENVEQDLALPCLTRDVTQTIAFLSFSGLQPHESDHQVSYPLSTDPEMMLGGFEKTVFNDFNLPETIHDLPAGASTGLCWHAIFENLDFAAQPDAVKAEVQHQLLQYGIGQNHSRLLEQHVKLVSEMVLNVLHVPLSDNTSVPFKLSEVSDDSRLTEISFEFAIPGAGTLHELLKLVIKHQDCLGVDLSSLDPEAIARHNWYAGYMTGFIDLVIRHPVDSGPFYILDWKSNRLTGSAEDFCQTGLQAEIFRHHYYLQYLLYTLALHKYLCYRLPEYDYERDIGGVFYVFLRGLNADDPGTGVFFDKPGLALINALDQYLCVPEERGG